MASDLLRRRAPSILAFLLACEDRNTASVSANAVSASATTTAAAGSSSAASGSGGADDGCPLPKDNLHVVDLSLDSKTTLALFSDGRVACWGWDTDDTCGHWQSGATFDLPTWATELKCMRSISAKAVAAGLDMQDRLWIWGASLPFDSERGNVVQPNAPWRATIYPDWKPDGPNAAVQTGIASILAKSQSRNLSWWGFAEFRTTTPVEVPLADVTTFDGDGANCAIQQDGELHCWGRGANGRLGQGDANLEDHATPIPVPGMTQTAQVSVGAFFVCATKRDGTVWCWGSNTFGNLGRGQFPPALEFSGVPMQPVGLPPLTAIAAGTFGVCAYNVGGEVYCWGDYMLGIDTHATPKKLVGAPPSKKVVVGQATVCGIAMDDSVWCGGAETGRNFEGGTAIGQVRLDLIQTIPEP